MQYGDLFFGKNIFVEFISSGELLYRHRQNFLIFRFMRAQHGRQPAAYQKVGNNDHRQEHPHFFQILLMVKKKRRYHDRKRIDAVFSEQKHRQGA